MPLKKRSTIQQSGKPRRVEPRMAPPKRAERQHARPGAGIKRSPGGHAAEAALAGLGARCWCSTRRGDDPALGDDHGRAVDRVAFQSGQRLIRLLQRKDSHLRPEPNLGCDCQKVVRIGARHVGDASDLPLAP
jgi:hypothetical protein